MWYMDETTKKHYNDAIERRLSEVFESDFDEWLKYGIVLNGRPLIQRMVKYDNGTTGLENVGLSVEGLEKAREAQKAYVEKCGLLLFEEFKICYQELTVKTKAIDFISFVLDGVGSNDNGFFAAYLKWVVNPQRFFVIMKNYFGSADYTPPTIENVREIYNRDVTNKKPISSWVQPGILNKENCTRVAILEGIKNVQTAETVLYGILKFKDYLLGNKMAEKKAFKIDDIPQEVLALFSLYKANQKNLTKTANHVERNIGLIDYGINEQRTHKRYCDAIRKKLLKYNLIEKKAVKKRQI